MNCGVKNYKNIDHRSLKMLLQLWKDRAWKKKVVSNFNCDDLLSYPFGFKTNKFNDLLPVGLLAQVQRCTGIAEVKGLNPK